MLEVDLPGAPPPHVAHARLAQRHATTFLLESRDGPQRLARHSFVGWSPRGVVRLDATGLRAEGDLPRPDATEPPLDYLRRLLRLHPPAVATSPFAGGLVGCAGFGLVRSLEPSLDGHLGADTDDWPRLVLGLYEDALVHDHATGRTTYVSHGRDRSAELRDALHQESEDRTSQPLRVGRLSATCTDAAFEAKVRQAIELDRAGECFQVVLSRAYEGTFTGPLHQAYAWLRDHANAPHLFFLRFADGLQLLGASPETLVRVRSGRAETFPIAGTRPIGATEAETRRLADDLRADAKEAAEHAMLVDLARNDLARVCAAGSVRVARFRDVERFRHVQHLVSLVEGQLAPGRDSLDAFAAVFPAGTVSGAPKLRAVEHLARLEGRPRGPYGGAVLYASFGGDLDSAIAIRSLSARGDRLTVQAGAGIVLASDPAAEARETRHKMATMLEGLGQFGATVDVDGEPAGKAQAEEPA
jgi:anthranilate synthase component 1